MIPFAWTGRSFHYAAVLFGALLGSVLLAGLGAGRVSADVITWDGETNGLWNTNTNWLANVAPVGDDSLVFGAAANQATTNDTAALTNYAGITFNQGGFSLGGNSITLTGDLSSTGDNTITLDMTVGAARAADVTANTLTISGVIDGAGGLSKTGAGTLLLSGDNGYTGGTTLAAGILGVGHDNALGTGGLSVTGDSTLQTVGGARSLANVVTLVGGFQLTVDTTTGDLSLAAGIGGSGALVKDTVGTLTINGTSTYDGGTTLSAGKLGIGADNALGTGTLTVTGGTLITSGGDRLLSNAVALDGDISVENGGVGGRQLTLSGAVTLSGDRQIATVGQTQVNLTNAVGDGGGAWGLTFSSDDGTGTLVLLGANTYTGGTTLSLGTIAVGDDDALGGGGLDVTGDATLAAAVGDRSLANAITVAGGTTLSLDTSAADLELDGGITGGGALSKTTAGTLDLNAANGYTGGTTLGGGTLGVGDDAALGTGQLDVTGDATLTALDADRALTNLVDIAAATVLTVDTSAANMTLGGIISGAGGLTKNTAGTLTLSALNTYAGDTTLAAGTLNLSGQVLGDVIVNGGTLMGTGTVGGGKSVTLNGGTFAPGNSIGTTTIAGDYTQNAGSTLEIELQKTGAGVISNDLLDVGGTATLNAGSTINVTDLEAGGVIATGDVFTIITTGVGVANGGPTITDSSAFLNFSGAVSGMDYQLIAARVATFANMAVGSNNAAVAAALDNDSNFVTGDGVTFINTLLGLNAAQFNDAAKQLSPEMVAGVSSSTFWTTRHMTGLMSNYLGARRSGSTQQPTVAGGTDVGRPLLLADASRDPHLLGYLIAQQEADQQKGDGATAGNADAAAVVAEQWNFFGRPFGVFHSQDSTATRAGFDADATGVCIGADRAFGPNLIGGLSFGYGHTWLDFHDGRGSGDVETFRFGPYATYHRDNFFADAAVSYGFHMNELDRNLTFGGLARTAHSDYQAHDISLYAGAGYDLNVGQVVLRPTASLEYIHYRHEGFTETGAGAAGLKVDADTSRSLRSKIGLGLSKVFGDEKVKVVPEVFGGWAHEYIDQEDINARFVGGVTPFSVTADRDDADSAYFGAAVSVLIGENTSIYVRYDGELASRSRTNAVSVGLSVSF